MSASTEIKPAAKRQKTEDKKSTRDIPFDRFKAVEVVIKFKSYLLPKRLLCHCSTFFDRTLNGKFKERQVHEVNLRETSTQALEIAIKRKSSDNFVLPARYEFDDDILDLTIGFMRLADYLDLLSPLTAPFEMVKTILVKDRNILESRHIKEVMKLPDGNKLRELTVKACVALYLESKVDRCKKPIRQPFKFNNDLTEIKNFRGDLSNT